MNGTNALSYQSVPFYLASYRDRLHRLHLSSFVYMTSVQRALVKHELLTTLFLIRLEAEKNKIARRRQALAVCGEDLAYCFRLLCALNVASPETVFELEEQVLSEDYSGRPVKYTGLLAYLDSAKQDDSSRESEIEALLEESYAFVRSLHQPRKKHSYRFYAKQAEEHVKEAILLVASRRRLWWAWGRNLWSSVILLFNEFNLHSNHAGNLDGSVARLGPVMNVFSWALFGIRTVIEIGESAREAMKLADASKESGEKKSFLTFFGQQLLHRKFVLLNDILNGTVNAMVFFWLNTPFKTELGLIGGMLTLSVFLFEILLAAWRYIEMQKTHHDLLAKLNAEAALLKQALSQHIDESALETLLQDIEQGKPITDKHGSLIDETHPHYEQIMGDIARFLSIKREKEKASMDWLIEEGRLLNTLTHRVAIAVGFIAMNAFYISGLPLMANIGMMIAGAGLCIVATIIFNSIDMMQTQEMLQVSMKDKVQQIDALMTQFLQAPSRAEKKGLYLQMRFLRAQHANDSAWSMYHLKCHPIQTLIDVLVPAVFFMSLHFLALGPAVGVLAVCVVVACAAKLIMKHMQPPKLERELLISKEDSEHERLERELDAFIDNPEWGEDVGVPLKLSAT